MDITAKKTLDSFQKDIKEGEALQKLYSEIYGIPMNEIKMLENYEVSSKTPYQVYEGFYSPNTASDAREYSRPVLDVYTNSGDVKMMRKPIYKTLIDILGNKK